MKIARSWDRHTLISIGKGAVIATLGSLAIFVSQNIKQINEAFQLSPELAIASTALASIFVNIVYQYNAGVDKSTLMNKCEEVNAKIGDIAEDVAVQAVKEVKSESKKLSSRPSKARASSSGSKEK